MTSQPVTQPGSQSAAEPAYQYAPLALEPAWQLLSPFDQLRQLLAHVHAVWQVEAAAILQCLPARAGLIDAVGIPMPWRQLPLAQYDPIERVLHHNERPCETLDGKTVRLAPLFVEQSDVTWGAVAFTVTPATQHSSDAAAQYLAALISAILSHAQQKHAIANYEQQRARARAQRDHLVRHARRGILYLDADARIDLINDRACDYLNWKREDVWQRPLTRLLSTLGVLGTKLGAALDSRPDHRVELSGRLPRHRMRGRDLDLSLEPDPHEPGAYWLYLSDPALAVTGGVVADETTQYLGRLQQLHLAVHEMRTPLASATLTLTMLDDMLSQSEPSNSPVVSNVNSVRQMLEQALEIMNDLSNWSSLGQKPNFEFCDLKVIAEEAIHQVEQSRRQRLQRAVKIRRAFAAHIPLIEGSSQRLRQLVTNLIKNAAESIAREDGEVEVLVRPLRRDQLASYALSAERQRVLNNGIELRVRDTGVGIPRAHQQQIFEPGVTYKLGGTGFGLSVVRTVVEQHNGEIRIESEVGVGTTFTILLPQRAEGLAAPPAQPE